MLQTLLTHSTPKTAQTKFIAIDGRAGSGKSTLAKLIGEQLGAQIIHTDDFAIHESTAEWWPKLVEHVFEPIKNGTTTLNYPRSKWWPTHHPEPVADQPVTPVMILEGVTALRQEFRDYVSIGIYVDTPRDICLQRGITRDLANDTGKTPAEVTAMWEAWAAREDEYLQRDNPQGYADIMVDGTQPFVMVDI